MSNQRENTAAAALEASVSPLRGEEKTQWQLQQNNHLCFEASAAMFNTVSTFTRAYSLKLEPSMSCFASQVQCFAMLPTAAAAAHLVFQVLEDSNSNNFGNNPARSSPFWWWSSPIWVAAAILTSKVWPNSEKFAPSQCTSYNYHQYAPLLVIKTNWS